MRPAMASAAITALMRTSSTWQTAWMRQDPEFRTQLARRGLDDPLTWAGLLSGRPDPRVELTTVFSALGVLDGDPAEATALLDAGLELFEAARAPADGWVQRMARLSNYQIAVDCASRAKAARLDEESRQLERMRYSQVSSLPVNWRGKKYRRIEEAGDEKAREKAEKLERERDGVQNWSRSWWRLGFHSGWRSRSAAWTFAGLRPLAVFEARGGRR